MVYRSLNILGSQSRPCETAPRSYSFSKLAGDYLKVTIPPERRAIMREGTGLARWNNKTVAQDSCCRLDLGQMHVILTLLMPNEDRKPWNIPTAGTLKTSGVCLHSKRMFQVFLSPTPSPRRPNLARQSLYAVAEDVGKALRQLTYCRVWIYTVPDVQKPTSCWLS